MNGMYMPLLLRASVIYMDKWDPRLAMQIVEKHQVTYGPAMPTYLSDIVSHPDFERYNLTTWRAARVSGGPITRSILADMRTRLPSLGLYPGWGMTEALFLTACGPGDSVEKLLTTDGRPLGDTEISIRAGDLDGEQATGEVGEILVRSGSTMRGYFAQPELTSSSFRDGWLLTGDLGCVDSDGYLTITGRSKDIIVRGGENVPVIHVEIAGHPAVKRVCVVGVPDSRLGEKVAAVVQTNGGPFTLDELIEFLREQNVTRQFIPEYLVIVEEFPVTSVGKPQRWKLRESALIGLGLLGA